MPTSCQFYPACVICVAPVASISYDDEELLLVQRVSLPLGLLEPLSANLLYSDRHVSMDPVKR